LGEKFVSLAEWIEKGQEERRKRHREALRAARDALAGRPVSVGGAGRNTTLYAAVRGRCADLRQDELSAEAAQELAAQINSGFPEPLSDAECRVTAQSAWERGCAARERKSKKLLGMLEDDDTPPE